MAEKMDSRALLISNVTSGGWNLHCMDSGSMHHFVGADSSCKSWSHAQYGELAAECGDQV